MKKAVVDQIVSFGNSNKTTANKKQTKSFFKSCVGSNVAYSFPRFRFRSLQNLAKMDIAQSKIAFVHIVLSLRLTRQQTKEVRSVFATTWSNRRYLNQKPGIYESLWVP